MVLTYWVLERRPCWWARPCDRVALAGLSWLPSQVQSEDGGMHGCADVCRWVLPSQCIEIARHRASWHSSLTSPATYVDQLAFHSLFLSEIVNYLAHSGKSFWILWCVRAYVLSERKHICVSVCACAHAFLQCQVDTLFSFSSNAVRLRSCMSEYNVLCVLRRRLWASQECSIWNMCAQA